MKETNPCLGCGCYDADFCCTMPSIDRSYACTLETGSEEANKIANILYNMSLDMDYMDSFEHWEAEINMIAIDIDVMKELDSPLFHMLDSLAYINRDMYDLITGKRWNYDCG